MSDYNEIISITLPADLAEIASKVGRAMDSDVGGADSFTLSADGLTISTTALCTSSYKAQADYLLEHPADLHAYCTQDYAARWTEFDPPTLEECEAFCAGVIRPPAPDEEPAPDPAPVAPAPPAAQDPSPAP